MRAHPKTTNATRNVHANGKAAWWQYTRRARSSSPLAASTAASKTVLASTSNWAAETYDKDQRGADEHARSAELDARILSFYLPTQTHCPVCHGTNLRRQHSMPDLILEKPGWFHLSRCCACGHLFQNPQLSEAGLAFYYRDCYSGLGQQRNARFLSKQQRSYRQRAKLLARYHKPQLWLDVGAGLGHFCQHARRVFTECQFEALDLGTQLQEAEAKGWVHRSYSGRFLDLAGTLGCRYDVVSMHHYLEHCRDPGAELRAAHALLVDEGVLLVEIPDPDCIQRFLLGSFWPGWLQPQHLHLYSLQRLRTLLHGSGFEVVAVQRAAAHMRDEFVHAAQHAYRSILAKPMQPRLQSQGLEHVALTVVLTTLQYNAALLGRGFDYGADALRWLPRFSNTLRVLARRRDNKEVVA